MDDLQPTTTENIEQPISADASQPVIQPQPLPVQPIIKFKLEIIDKDNVRKIGTREDVSVLNIPGLQQQKKDIEAEIERLQDSLTQINEVLDEYNKLN